MITQTGGLGVRHTYKGGWRSAQFLLQTDGKTDAHRGSAHLKIVKTSTQHKRDLNQTVGVYMKGTLHHQHPNTLNVSNISVVADPILTKL